MKETQNGVPSFEEISIRNEHPIFKGFPEKISITDEFYWDLNRNDGVEILGSVRTGPDKNSTERVPKSMLSAKQPRPCSGPTKLAKDVSSVPPWDITLSVSYDPELRIILFRAMASTMREKPEPLMPLVFHGITNSDGMVGTTDDMRNWKGKLRGPPKN